MKDVLWKDFLWVMVSYAFELECVGIPILSFFGLVGNILSIIIFFTSHRHISLHSNFINLLICLAIFDSLFLIFMNLTFTTISFSESHTSHYFHACPYLLALSGMSLTGSVYSVLAITINRYTTIRQSHAKIFSAKVMIFFIIFISVSFNFIRFFLFTAEEVDGQILIKPTWLRKNHIFYIVYGLIINFLVMTLIPTVVLTVLNIFILRSISQMTQNKSDTAMATLLFSIVIVSLVCHSPRIILNIYEGFFLFAEGHGYWPKWGNILNHLLLVLNSSINIIIYTARDIKFRQALVKMFQCKSVKSVDFLLRNITSEVTKEDIISEA